MIFGIGVLRSGEDVEKYFDAEFSLTIDDPQVQSHIPLLLTYHLSLEGDLY